MGAVGLRRREAEDALKLTGGDVAAALDHQLGRLRLNTAALDCLVWEYATTRCANWGMVNSDTSQAAGAR